MDQITDFSARWEGFGPRYGDVRRLAELADLSPEYVSRLLGGRYDNCTIGTIEALNAALDRMERERAEALLDGRRD